MNPDIQLASKLKTTNILKGKTMKQVFLISAFLTINVFPQWNTGAVKLGYFNPSATDGGFIIGIEGGQHFDKLMSWTQD